MSPEETKNVQQNMRYIFVIGIILGVFLGLAFK